MIKLRIIALVAFFLVYFIQPNVWAKEKTTPQTKTYLNDIEYIGINFKISEDYDDVEFKSGKFKKLNNASDNFTMAINALPFLKKIKRLHQGKSYKEFREQSKSKKLNGRNLPKLENWYRIAITSKMNTEAILKIYNALVRIPFIVYVELETPVIPLRNVVCPTLNCEPPGGGGGGGGGGGSSNPTPNLESYQTYLGPSPLGIDAEYAWTKNGGNGYGVKIIDMENGYNSNHEDLPSPFIRKNDLDNSDHGTAVMSVVGAKDNNKGVTGIAHGSQIGFYGWGSSASASIVAAANSLNSGDVIILEGQINRNIYSGDRCNDSNQDHCVPMEWNRSNYEAIKYAYQQGVIVIEAAGNGNENLDANIYGRKFDKSYRNSGAFMVAATNPYSTITRSSFSNYGSRVDFNAWGNNVAAAGLYGSTLFNGGVNRTYGDGFAGTSSASPIVAGAVASLQGYSKRSKGGSLDVDTIRSILTTTGVSEPPGLEVGVRPDLRAAITAIDNGSFLLAPSLSSYWDACYGSNLMTWNSIPETSSYKIYLNGNYWSTTTTTFKQVNISSSRSATVRACNNTGCSDHSNRVTLKYAPGCY